MTPENFVWDHFKFNAEQRLKAFNFFVILSIFADGGIFAALDRDFAPLSLGLLGVLVLVFSSVFLLVDIRSKQLLALTIPALMEIEAKMPPSHQMFRQDSELTGVKRWAFRYTVAFRILLVCQAALGVWVICWAVWG